MGGLLFVDENKSEERLKEIAFSMGKINQKVLFAGKQAFQVNLEEHVQNAIKREQNLIKTIK